MFQILAKMESHHATWKNEVQKCCTYMQISFAKSCKYHAIWKGLFSKCRRCRARGSISTMQVDVAECWTYCKCHANSVVCFQFFLPWWFHQFSVFLALQNFRGFLTSWLCLCPPVHRNQSHKRKEITKTAYTQTKTTTSTVVGVFLQLHQPQQQPQQQQQQQRSDTL